MSKIILTLLVGWCCLMPATFTQAQTASTRIFSEEGYKFWLVLNGIRQNDEPKASVEVKGLKSQLYRAKIIFEKEDLEPLDQNIFTSDMDGNVYHSVYRIRERKTFFGSPTGELVVRLQSADKINGTPDYQQEPIEVKEEEQRSEASERRNPGDRADRRGVERREEASERGSDRSSRGRSRSSERSSQRGGADNSTVKEEVRPEPPKSYVEGYNGQIGCERPMSAAAFKRAKNSIANQSFSSTQLDVAKQVADANCLSVAQVKEIAAIFGFENGRLEFAKYAYHSTHDVDNYFEINDVFSFSASVSELNEYIRRNR